MTCTIQIGSGSPYTFSELGISAARLADDAGGQSFLELETAQPITASAIIAPFQKVVLRADGVVRFVGWLDAAPRYAVGNAQRVLYRLTGPHRWLEAATFTQARAGLTLLGGSAGDGLNQDPALLSDAISEIITAALAVYPDTFSSTGGSEFDYQIPIERRVDISCWQALRSVLGYAPTAVLWWSYGDVGDSTNPVLHIADGDHAADRTLSTDTYNISAATLNPRYDLLADTVHVYYTKDGSLSSPQSSGPSGDAATLGANRARVFTFDAGSLYNVPTSGLATALAAWSNKLHIDGSATKLSVDWEDHAGDVVGFGGELFRLSGYTTQVYSVTRDLFSEETTLALGVMPGKGIVPLSGRAEEVNSAEKSTDSGGGGGGSPEPDPATITRSIKDPNGDAVPDSYFFVGSQTAASGASISIPPGDYTIGFIVPPDYITPTPEAVTVAEGESSTDDATAPFRYRMRLRYADDGTVVIDLNTDDIPDGKGPAMFREIERCDGKRAMVLMTDWYDPA